MVGENSFSLEIPEADVGTRLDVVISNLVVDCSRSAAADWIRKGFVSVQGETKKPSYRVRRGDLINGRTPSPQPIDVKPEPIDLDIIHEDESIIVVNKSAGMVVHPAPGHGAGTLVNGLLYHFPDLAGKSGEIRPGIVHRLDKDTTGTLIIAKTPSAHIYLSDQFKARQVIKKYIALIHGTLKDDSGQIIKPIGRHPTDRKKMSVHSKSGRYAETHWTVRERFKGFTMLELTIKTGRTHQIRVHLASISHPVVGDPLYGKRPDVVNKFKNAELNLKLRQIKRQMLHAWQLDLKHPVSNQLHHFESPWPKDMQDLICLFRSA